ncbi:MAG TPA: electron transport complex subunit RsxC [bacterium]|nr:electron transport complex subunit RsxC [bacterium]
MRIRSFRGGVHPPEEKITSQKPIQELPLPKKVVIPLSQHTGVPARPTVKVGDRVKTGQRIGEAQGPISSNIHTSISGKITSIENHPHPLGPPSLAITIESDGRDEHHPSVKHNNDYFKLHPNEIREIVRGAGIVGLGGAAFPTHVKLSPPEDRWIDTVILNGCECEPYLTCDHRLMIEKTYEIIEGLKIIAKTLEVTSCYVGIEKNKEDAIKAMREEIRNKANMEIVSLKTKYPQGSEKQLIEAILNRKVPSGGLPLDVGVVVQNVGTALAISEAVKKGRPLIERVITVTGRGIKNPANLRVRMGTLFKDMIDYCGGFAGKPGKIIMGGALMGFAQHTLDVPVIKGTTGILLLTEDEVNIEEPQPCIKCARCVDSCPIYLLPLYLGIYGEKELWRKCEELGALDCTECGCCAYICPARIPLVQLIKLAKQEIAAYRKKK